MTYGRPGVYISERFLPTPIAVGGTANAAGAAIGAFAKGPSAVTRITSWYDFVKNYGTYDAAYPATFGIAQFFANGGSELYVKRVLGSGAGKATVNIVNGATTVAVVTAKNSGSSGTNLRVELAATGVTNYYNLNVWEEAAVGGTSSSTLDDNLLETFNNVVFNSTTSADYVATVVNQGSAYITISVSTNATAPTAGLLPLTGSSLDGTAPVASDYVATVATNGTSEFDQVDRPLVIFAPEIISVLGATNGTTVLNGLIAWANSGMGFAVVDTDDGLTVANAITAATSYTASSQAAVYYPNYYIADPVARSSSALRLIGPAGAVAGLYLQNDRSAGPFKTPAGLQNNITGAIALERAFTSGDLDTLNSSVKPLNALRNLPGAGTVVMGGRTLKQDGTPNRYVGMRRSLIYIKKNIESLTQFALFENNDENLWARVITSVSVFLNQYNNQGGLRGNTPEEAYFIKCDQENNTPATIANGEVHIEIGVALEYPAEFVVINLSQKTA
jgi:phage tail sheath protein FI